MTAPPPFDWRPLIPVHPACELIRRMTADELDDLALDIQKNGLIQPIVVWRANDSEPYQLLDGRSRLDAMASLPGGAALIKEALRLPVYKGASTDPFRYVLSVNAHRRHLTPAEKRETVERLLRSNPAASNRSVGQIAGVDHKTVAVVRATSEATGAIPQLPTRTGADGKTRPAHQPAREPATQPPESQEDAWGRLRSTIDTWKHPYRGTSTKAQPIASPDAGEEGAPASALAPPSTKPVPAAEPASVAAAPLAPAAAAQGYQVKTPEANKAIEIAQDAVAAILAGKITAKEADALNKASRVYRRMVADRTNPGRKPAGIAELITLEQRVEAIVGLMALLGVTIEQLHEAIGPWDGAATATSSGRPVPQF